MSAFEQEVGNFGMAGGARELEHNVPVPIEFEPLQPVDDGIDCCIR